LTARLSSLWFKVFRFTLQAALDGILQTADGNWQPVFASLLFRKRTPLKQQLQGPPRPLPKPVKMVTDWKTFLQTLLHRRRTSGSADVLSRNPEHGRRTVRADCTGRNGSGNRLHTERDKFGPRDPSAFGITLLDLTLNIRVEGGGKLPIVGQGKFITLQLTPVGNGTTASIPISASRIGLAPPITDYIVSIDNLPEGYKVKSVKFGSAELTDSILKITTATNVSGTNALRTALGQGLSIVLDSTGISSFASRGRESREHARRWHSTHFHFRNASHGVRRWIIRGP
jgi:hypothetical protein